MLTEREELVERETLLLFDPLVLLLADPLLLVCFRTQLAIS